MSEHEGALHGDQRAVRAVASRVAAVEAELCELAGLIHAAQADMVRLLAEFDRLGAWQGAGIRSIGQWAAINLGIDARTAGLQTRAGHRLAALPAIRAACEAGEIGWAKARYLADVAEPATEDRWLDLAREMSVTQLARLSRAYRRATDTDDPDRLESARERRGIWLFDQPDGLVRVTGLLEPDDAAVLRAALAAQAERLWRNHTSTPTPDDTDDDRSATPTQPPVAGSSGADAPGSASGPGSDRDAAEAGDRADRDAPEARDGADPDAADDAAGGSAGESSDNACSGPADPVQEHDRARPSEIDPTRATRDPVAVRTADALVTLARTALAAGDAPDDGDDLTQVILHVDAALFAGHTEVARCHLDHGPALATPTAERLACDAVIRPLLVRNGLPLAMGRAQRLVTRAQRRALRARDRGCVFPGCGHTRHLHAHHIRHWTRGGPTDLDNLVLLCRHHHRLHHEGGYTVTMRDGRPRFHRPDGTPIHPPRHQPRAKPAVVDLRDHATHHGHTITPTTPRARSGGATDWSLQCAIDALTS